MNLIPITTTLYLYIYHVECPLYVANLIIKVISGSFHEWSQSIFGEFDYLRPWFRECDLVFSLNKTSFKQVASLLCDYRWRAAELSSILSTRWKYWKNWMFSTQKRWWSWQNGWYFAEIFEYMVVREKFLILPQKPGDPTATKSVRSTVVHVMA